MARGILRAGRKRHRPVRGEAAIPEEIVFTWTAADGAGANAPRARAAWRDPWAAKPAWARVAGFGCAALSSTSPPATAPHWILLREAPIVGRAYPLRVWLPFRGALGDAIWVAYPPPATSPEVTEWCDVPAALPTGGLARCRFLAVLSHDEPDSVYLPGAWLHVAIEEVITLPDLAAHFAPDTTGRPLPPDMGPAHRYTRGCHWGDLYYIAHSVEGDIHEWAVWQRRPDGAAAILGGERIFDDDIVYAGHRPLSAAELAELEAWQAAAERDPGGTLPPPPAVQAAPAATTRPHDAEAGCEQRRVWRLWERWRSRP